MREADLLVPAAIGDYTDFYASIFHATSVERLFRPDNPLLPNYKHLPVAYHGRSSSIVANGTSVRRPTGQKKAPDAEVPTFGFSEQLDYELEVGLLVGKGNDLGHPIALNEAEDHVFGLCLITDWSARDLRAWEYPPLGPFLAKSFATSIAPWVVTTEALAPFRCPAFPRPNSGPKPLPYLTSVTNTKEGGLDITLEVLLRSTRMREDGLDPIMLSQTSFQNLYWTIGQMVTHHTSNGCNLRPGDILASGTVSGPEEGSQGCLLALTRSESQPLRLSTDEERRFLSNGDEVVIRGYCERAGYVRIGFGEGQGVVLPAVEGGG